MHYRLQFLEQSPSMVLGQRCFDMCDFVHVNRLHKSQYNLTNSSSLTIPMELVLDKLERYKSVFRCQLHCKHLAQNRHVIDLDRLLHMLLNMLTIETKLPIDLVEHILQISVRHYRQNQPKRLDDFLFYRCMY